MPARPLSLLVLVALTACAGAPRPAAEPARVPAAATYWEPLPAPPAGNVRALARTRGGMVLAGAMTGVYAADDGARGWRLHGMEGSTIESLLVTRSGTVLAGAYRQGVHRSTDGGRTWEQVGFDRSVYVPGLVEDGEGRLYAAIQYATHPGAPTGVFRSDDDGRTWTAAGLQDLDVSSLSAPGDGALYAGTDRGLRRSTDGGVSWTDAGGRLPADAEVSAVVAVGAVLLLGTRGDIRGQLPGAGVYRSDDVGRSWRAAREGLPSNVSITSLASLGDTVFASADAGGVGVYRSVDGRPWTPVGPRGVLVNRLLVTGPGRIVAGTEGDGAFASADGGRTWVEQAEGLREWFVGDILAYDDGRLLAGDIRGVHRSDDGGRTWHAPAARYIGAALARAADGRVFAGAEGKLYVSSSHGASWDTIDLGSRGRVYDLWFDAACGGLVTLRNATPSLFQTRDCGSTWQPLDVDGGPAGTSSALATPAGAIVAATGRGIQRLADGTWEVVLASVSAKKLASCGGAVFAATRGAGVLRSTDDGRTWTPVTEALRASPDLLQPGILFVHTVTCMPGGKVLIGTNGDGVFATDDDGATWRDLSAGLRDRTVYGISSDGRGGVFAATVAGVHRASLDTLFGREPARDAGGAR